MVTLEMVHLVAETCDKLEKDGQMIISYQETVMVQLVVSQKMVRFCLVKQVLYVKVFILAEETIRLEHARTVPVRYQ